MAQDVTSRRLEAAFTAAGISQAELARLSGIDRGSISLYLSGRYHPKADKLLRLAEALKVSPQWLSGIDDAPEQSTDVRLPVYCGLGADGALLDTGETFAVPQSWLDEGADWFLIRVTGLAMYPRCWSATCCWCAGRLPPMKTPLPSSCRTARSSSAGCRAASCCPPTRSSRPGRSTRTTLCSAAPSA